MRILFVTATRIGDAVLSTGLLSHLIGRFPDAGLTIAVGPAAAPLFEAVPGLQRLIVLQKRRWALHWLPLYARTIGRRWDLVVDLRGSALAWLLWAGERRVMAKGDPHEHRVRQLARLFGLDPPPGPMIWTAPSHDRAAEALVPPGGPVLAIGPAANWRGKEWRAERRRAIRPLGTPDRHRPCRSGLSARLRLPHHRYADGQPVRRDRRDRGARAVAPRRQRGGMSAATMPGDKLDLSVLVVARDAE